MIGKRVVFQTPDGKLHDAGICTDWSYTHGGDVTVTTKLFPDAPQYVLVDEAHIIRSEN